MNRIQMAAVERQRDRVEDALDDAVVARGTLTAYISEDRVERAVIHLDTAVEALEDALEALDDREAE
jgi:hypothetical protein